MNQSKHEDIIYIRLTILIILMASGVSTVAREIYTEDKKTKGLVCYEVGFRYGYTATNSMNGQKTNPLWDFSIPERCRNIKETDKGILEGTRAAWQ